MIKTRDVKVIDCSVWDLLVRETYEKPYALQQQDGCMPRGNINIRIPDESYDDEMNDTIPVDVQSEVMGVKFDVWKNTGPNEFNFEFEWESRLFWKRNFYPDLQTVANDLHNKGLIEAGDYMIVVDW